MSDILDDIDALIDEQLEHGEAGVRQRAAAAERRCPHCRRDWHGLAITQRMERMRIDYEREQLARWNRGEETGYAESAILDDYRYAEDDSPILCPGSEFIGPMPAPPRCECGACRHWRTLLGDDPTPGDVLRMTASAAPPSLPAAESMIGAAIQMFGSACSLPDDPFDLGAWRDIGTVAEAGFRMTWTQQEMILPRSWALGSYSFSELLAADSGPSRAERRHPQPETSPESDSPDLGLSLREIRRRERQRRAQPQEQPIWAACADGRRGRR